MANFCQQALKPRGSYTRDYHTLHRLFIGHGKMLLFTGKIRKATKNRKFFSRHFFKLGASCAAPKNSRMFITFFRFERTDGFGNDNASTATVTQLFSLFLVSHASLACELDTYLKKALHSRIPETRVRDPAVWSRQSVRLCCQHKTGDKDESDSQLEHGVI